METSFTTASPEWVSAPKSFVSLFAFMFCSTSFQRDWFAFLGIWGPPPVFRSCFVEIAPHTDDLLMYLWGRKWSPCPIPPPSWDASPTTALLTAAPHSFVGMFHKLFNQSPVVGICVHIYTKALLQKYTHTHTHTYIYKPSLNIFCPSVPKNRISCAF